MEYHQIKEYLDRLIHVRDKAKSVEDLNSNIQSILISFKDSIQIYKGIEIIADVMGVELKSRKRKDGNTEFFFNYAKTEFFQLGSSDTEKP